MLGRIKKGQARILIVGNLCCFYSDYIQFITNKMSVFLDQWRKEAYYPRQALHLRDLPENHIKRVKEVPFEFQEYRANHKFPCLPYERTLIQCINNYGLQGSYEVPECLQMNKFLGDCLSINKYFGTMKRWNPEHFAENEYSRERVNLSDIGF